MVKYQAATLDRTFAALSDPPRRALLALIGRSAKNLGVIEEELEKLALAFRPATERDAPATARFDGLEAAERW